MGHLRLQSVKPQKLQFEKFVNLFKVLLRAVKVVLASLRASLAVGRGCPVFRACFYRIREEQYGTRTTLCHVP